MNIMKKSIALAIIVGVLSAAPAVAQDDNRNSTVGGDSGVSGNVQEVSPDESHAVENQEDSDVPKGRVVNVNIPTVEDKIRNNSRRTPTGGDISSQEESASQGSDSDSGSTGSSQSGNAEVSNEEVKKRVDEAVSEDNAQYKTVLDYFAAHLHGAVYNWGGPIGEVGAGGDCSGFLSQLVQIIDGGNPWQRIFATFGQADELSKRGFALGGMDTDVKAGDFAIGFNTTEHTAGTLPTQVAVESGGATAGDPMAAGGKSINSYGSDLSSGWDGKKSGSVFDQVAVLPWDKMPDKVKWDESVSEWEKYLDGVSWKPWAECSGQGGGSATDPCASVKDKVNKENGWEEKLENYPQ